jgi:hypothetical protein
VPVPSSKISISRCASHSKWAAVSASKPSPTQGAISMPRALSNRLVSKALAVDEDMIGAVAGEQRQPGVGVKM